MSSGTSVLLVVVIATASGQPAKGGGGTSFRWDSGPFLELDLTHTIGSARDLDLAEQASLTLAIEMRLKKSKDDLEITSPRELYRVASQSRVKFVDLNHDGTPEAIVQPVGIQGGCGATGNCPFWIFTRKASGYKSLLEIEEGVQMFRIERNLTNNFQDIAVASHDYASEKTIFNLSLSEGQVSKGWLLLRLLDFDKRGPLVSAEGTVHHPMRSYSSVRPTDWSAATLMML